MIYEEIDIGPSPCDEPCAQVGDFDYHEKSHDELTRFASLIKKKFGEPPEGARLKIKAFPHELGTYHELVVRFDTACDEAAKYAFAVQENAPLTWNDDSPVDWRAGE